MMSHMKKLLPFALLFLLWTVVATTGCKPDDPVDPNEEEVITKVQLTFTDSTNGSNTFDAIYSDPDGDGGNAPVRFDTIRLDSGTTYSMLISLYDESDPGNVVDITDEVEAEASEHLFCYTVSGVNVTVVRTDSDGTFPIGIRTNWRAAMPSTGSVRVELRHQPDGTKDGTCTPGATDVQLDFVLEVR